MDLGLQGKVALVTAASKGLGKAIAWELAREGCRVAICAREQTTLDATAEEIRHATGAEVLALPCNVTQADQIDRLVASAQARFGRIDILVNNAGGPPTGSFAIFDDAAWQRALDLNLMSAVRLCRAVLPGMKERGWGRIINSTSVMVKQPEEGFVLSTAARAGLVGMAKTIAAEYAAAGITVNNVCPGYTLTDRVRALAESRMAAEGRSYEEVLADYAAEIPAGRLGRPEELAALVVFLASERASYITGATIPVDGGYCRALL